MTSGYQKEEFELNFNHEEVEKTWVHLSIRQASSSLKEIDYNIMIEGKLTPPPFTIHNLSTFSEYI